MTERLELISHLEQLAALLRASPDALHRDVLASVSGYLRTRLDAMPVAGGSGRAVAGFAGTAATAVT